MFNCSVHPKHKLWEVIEMCMHIMKDDPHRLLNILAFYENEPHELFTSSPSIIMCLAFYAHPGHGFL